jgi:hypothetical protein
MGIRFLRRYNRAPLHCPRLQDLGGGGRTHCLRSHGFAHRYGSLTVFQIQRTHRQTAVPLTRDYVTDFDRGFVHPGNAGRYAAERTTHAKRETSGGHDRT